MTRLYQPGPLEPHTCVLLSATASHHAVRVLRLRSGAPIELFNGTGQRAQAHLVDENPQGASARIATVAQSTTESPLRLGLAQALPAGDKMDWVIEKAIELGVTAIAPILSAKSVIKLDERRAERRLAHWHNIVIAACMQSGRDTLPQLAAPTALHAWLRATPALSESAPQGASSEPLRLILSPHEAAPLHTLPSPAAPPPSVWVLVGPEGGWTPDEQHAAHAAGWHAVQLGPRILRTETAGLAALAVLQARWGDYT